MGLWGIRGSVCWSACFSAAPFKTSVRATRRARPPLGSVLVVGLLRPRAGQAVLGLAGARAQAVQPPAVLGVVDVVLEEKLKEKRRIFEFGK